MPDFLSKHFDLTRIRETDMVGYLAKLGHVATEVRKNGTDHW